MGNTSAIIRYLTAAVVCSSILLYGFYDSVFGGKISAATPDGGKTVSLIIQTETNYKDDELQSIQSSTETEETSIAEEIALPASSDGTVQGRIIERFISPYTANTSWDNIYLKNNTNLKLNLQDFAESNLAYKIEKNGEPQVLILHTHATESYMLHTADYYTNTDNSRTTDCNYNMVRLGKVLADKLNSAGITTIHDTTAHDYPSYNESYSRSAKTVNSYLEKYPSIKIVIDLHRDAIAANDTDKVKTVTEIEGKKAAQIMLVMGSQSGSVKNFPKWEENLKLAVKMQQSIEEMYPTLARSIHFMPKNYNQSLSTGSVLIEIGTDGNTIEEAVYSAQLLGNSLIKLFEKLG